MTPSLAVLDQTTLLQRAADAGAGQDAAAALAYLQEAVSRADAGAAAHFLLGAEYAQTGLYERAVTHMEAAVARDPALAVARLQLGLLLLSCGAAARAWDCLQPLQERGGDDALALFGQGLSHLIQDRLADAAHCLRLGMACNDGNAALNADMQKIVAAIGRLAPDDAVPDARHILLAVYAGNGNA